MSKTIEAPATDAPADAPAESLLHDGAPPSSAPAAPADSFTFADKVLVKDGEAVNWEQTARKAEQARQHLEKRLGAGDTPPASAAEYAFTMPKDMKDFELAPERVEKFKSEAHAKGITQQQFEWMMGAYMQSVPDLMAGSARMSAQEARAELGKVWTTGDAMSAGLDAGSRAMRALPADLQDAARELGTNPTFVRAMAYFGEQMREDRPPSGQTPAPAGDVRTLMGSPAYMDPRHPDHQRVSEQVRQHFARAAGTEPI